MPRGRKRSALEAELEDYEITTPPRQVMPKGIRKRFYSRSKAAKKFLASRKKKRVIQYGYPGVKGARGMEFKAVDNANFSSNADTGGGITLLNGIGRGDDMHERMGREVVLRSLQLHGSAAVTSGTGVDQTQRVLIVYDRQCNAATPAITDVLVSANVRAMRNLNNRKRFKILVDERIALNASGEPGSHKAFDYYKRFYLPVTFNSGDAGTVADIVTGGLFAMVLGDMAPGATAGTVTMTSRVRFTDF